MIKVIKDNIVNMDVDVIVNAANSSLAGGGGVDGTIHNAAGNELYDACRKIGHCDTGKAVITDGFKLKAKYIIHTVGPIYNNYDEETSEELLSSCYVDSLDLAKQYNLHSIAFPCISCGVYGYPLQKACNVAKNAVNNWLSDNNYDIDVFFVCFSDREYTAYNI